jgi:predicted RNase H-like nuclease
MTVIGVDGCRAGWLAVSWNGFPDDRPVAAIAARFRDILDFDGDIIAVDIPIGLPDIARNGRGCDGEVRRLLRRKSSSVFPAPARPTLTARNHAEASAINRRHSDPSHGISAQNYNILAKIADVDIVMTATIQRRVHEVHPELCFYMMNDRTSVLEKKRAPDGYAKRRRLLAKSGFPLARLVPPSNPRRDWADDDLIDACACAWAARRIRDGDNIRFSATPPHDSKGLRMEINA